MTHKEPVYILLDKRTLECLGITEDTPSDGEISKRDLKLIAERRRKWDAGEWEQRNDAE